MRTSDSNFYDKISLYRRPDTAQTRSEGNWKAVLFCFCFLYLRHNHFSHPAEYRGLIHIFLGTLLTLSLLRRSKGYTHSP